jgi:NDP-sugar pyrophosphorylase family protein
MVVPEDINDLLKKNESKDYKFNVTKYNIKAPVKIGDKLGILEVFDNEGRIVKKIEHCFQRAPFLNV